VPDLFSPLHTRLSDESANVVLGPGDVAARGLRADAARRREGLMSTLVSFLLGAVAPLSLVGWLLCR